MEKIFMGKLVTCWPTHSLCKIGRVIAVNDRGLAVKLCSYRSKFDEEFKAPFGTGVGFFPFDGGIAEVTKDWMKVNNIEKIKEY